jgi:predicted transposase YbfD/YdcC
LFEVKSNEIPQGSTLLDPLEIKDKVVTLSLLSTQKKTAKYLVEEKKAHYFFTVKGNQPSFRQTLNN